jgi:hypothetical protein
LHSKKEDMVMTKRFLPLIAAMALLASCAKEVSQENGGTPADIIGADCRISSIVYSNAAAGVGLGSVSANINTSDRAVEFMDFDSLNFTINRNVVPTYSGDTIRINANEYFLAPPPTLRVTRFHTLLDPTDPTSPQIDIDYTYNASGYLVKKTTSFTLVGTAVSEVNYAYTGPNMIRMEEIDLTTGFTVNDADVSYAPIQPKNFLYIFPDELSNPLFTQFLNFGTRPYNAVSNITLRFYDPATSSVLDSAVSNFSNYQLSADRYVLNCTMTGDDQPSLPAKAGRLSFKYKCK